MDFHIIRYIGDGSLLHVFDLIYLKTRKVPSIINDYHLRLFRKRLRKRAEKAIQSEIVQENSSLFERLYELIPSQTREWLIEESSHKERIIESAQNIVQGKYSIFELNDITIEKPDWHSDYRSGYRWPPGKFFTQYKVVDLDNDADPKVVWELNRFHHLSILGQAFIATGNEQYASLIIEQMLSWINSNPFASSINWTYPMEVSIRAINWIWALSMISGSDAADEKAMKEILSSLYLHGVFLFRYPSPICFNKHNHYLSNMIGEIYLGFLFSGIGIAKDWFSHGMKGLFAEIRTQILPSGVDYERSISYHRLVLELITSGIAILLRAGIFIPSDIVFRLERMFDFVEGYLMPDGMAPIIGDWDNGVLHRFSSRPTHDHSYLLSIRDRLFNRFNDSNEYSNESVDAKLLFANEFGFSSDGRKSIKDMEIVSFADAGFFIVRTDRLYCFINMSGKGRYPDVCEAGTHTHSDVLSFVLCYENSPFLIDPGSYIYSGNPEMRALFRSTEMHNTLSVDDKDQYTIRSEELWGFEGNTFPRLLRLEKTDGIIVIEGEHSGYADLFSSVIHKRTFRISRNSPSMEIHDFLKGDSTHLVNVFFHFAQYIELKNTGENILAMHPSGKEMLLSWSCSQEIQAEISTGWISPGYGKKVNGSVLRLSGTHKLPSKIIFTINCSHNSITDGNQS